jgi:hypothetical protein
MSKLIIICNEEHADKIVPSHFELDFAKKIPVYGKLKLSRKTSFGTWSLIFLTFWLDPLFIELLIKYLTS